MCCCGKKPHVIWGIIFGVGVGLFALGFIFAYAAFPAIIQAGVKKELNLWNENTEGRKNFNSPPVDLYMTFHLFIVTNAEAVENGTSMPRVEEKGPYSYREIRLKQNMSEESEDKDHIRFGQYKAYEFSKERSCEACFDDDEHVFINAPLLGVVDLVTSLENKTIVNATLTAFNAAITGALFPDRNYTDTLFIKFKVKEFLFDGIKPGTIRLLLDLFELTEGNGDPEFVREIMETLPVDAILGLQTLLPSLPRVTLPPLPTLPPRPTLPPLPPLPPPPPVITKDGFAVFMGKNATAKNEFYSVNTGRSDMSQYVEIEMWGPSMDELMPDLTGADWWEENGGYLGSNDCNTLRGTDGQQFHPDVKKKDRLWIFQTDICRVMFIEYKEKVNINGIDALRFYASPEALQTNTTFNLGFCMEIEPDYPWDTCPKPDPNNGELLDLSDCGMTERICPSGILDITRCMRGAPVFISSPYFFQSPQWLRDDIGMPAPVVADHETQLDIEPVSGAAIAVHKRIQVNIPLVQNDFVTLLNKIKYADAPDAHLVVLPMLWLDEGADIDEENTKLVKKMVVTPITVTEVIQWLMVAVGALMMVAAVAYFIRRHHKRGKFV